MFVTVTVITLTEGARFRTLDRQYHSPRQTQPARPRRRSRIAHPRRGLASSGTHRAHPTHTQGANPRTLDADSPTRRGSTSPNTHRGRKVSHPRQAIPQPKTDTAHPTRAEGANPRILGTDCPIQEGTGSTQLPPKAQDRVPSTRIRLPAGANRGDQRHVDRFAAWHTDAQKTGMCPSWPCPLVIAARSAPSVGAVRQHCLAPHVSVSASAPSAPTLSILCQHPPSAHPVSVPVGAAPVLRVVVSRRP